MLSAFILGLLVAGGAPKNAETITFSCPGATVENALKQLGEVTSQKLDAAKDLQGLPLIISANGMDRQELFDAIEDCFSATWVGDKDHWTLTPNQAKILSRTAEAKANLAASLENQLNGYNPGPGPDPGMENILSSLMKAAQSTVSDEQSALLSGAYFSGSQYMTRFLGKAVRAQDLVDLKPGERVVYSNQPTRMQRPFTSGMASALSQFNELVTDFRKRIEGTGFSPRLILDQNYRNTFQRNMDQLKPTKRALIALSNLGLASQFQISFSDPDTGSDSTLSLFPGYGVPPQISARRQKLWAQLNLSRSEDKKIRVSERAMKAVSLMGADSHQERPSISQRLTTLRSLIPLRKLTPQELDDLANPDRVDPLSWYVGECVDQIAKSEHINVVASPNDNVLIDFAKYIRDAHANYSLVMYLLAADAFKVFPELLHISGRTLVLRQDLTKLYYSRPAVDRRQLKIVLARLKETPYFDSEEGALLGIKSNSNLGWIQPWIQACSEANIEGNPYNERSTALAEAFPKWDSSPFSKQFPVSKLSPNQMACVSAVLFGAPTNTFRRKGGMPVDVTDALPNGLPRDAVVTLRWNSYHILYGWTVSAETSSKASAYLSTRGFEQYENLLSNQKFLPVDLSNLTMSVTANEMTWNSVEALYDSRRVGDTVTDWKKLPKEFLDYIGYGPKPVH